MLCVMSHAMSSSSTSLCTAGDEFVLQSPPGVIAKLRTPAAQPPSRLMPLAPPTNYGTVEAGAWYRSGFPDEDNLDFLESLGIRSIVTLVDSAPSDAYQHYIQRCSIAHKHVALAANKDGKVMTTIESLCHVLAFVLNPANFPVYIHCNQGKHRTGCVVGCLRRIQGWPLEEILAEYDAYASPKARSADIELITTFDPDALVGHSRTTDDFEWVKLGVRNLEDVSGLTRINVMTRG